MFKKIIYPSEVQFEEETVSSQPLTRPTTHKVSHTTGGIIPKAKIKTIKMTFVIILGEAIQINFANFLLQSEIKQDR